MNTGFSFQNRLYGLVISWLYWLKGGLYFQAFKSPPLHCNLDTPFNAWPLHIHVLLEGGNRCLCKCHNLGYRLKKDVTSSKNMGRFGPVLVRPGRFGLILGVGLFSLKGESFRP